MAEAGPSCEIEAGEEISVAFEVKPYSTTSAYRLFAAQY